jgi:hypothetical protein
MKGLSIKRNSYLKFDLAVRDFYGSNNTAIAFSRLLYWFRKKPDGFYKFKQPCRKHPLYKKGDSWGEELGMSRKILDPIFSRLINHHGTKRDFLKQADRFKGKMFASYTNHKTNQTHYFIDRDAVDSFLHSLSIKNPLQCPLPSSGDVPSEAKTIPSDQSCDVPVVPPLARAHPSSPVLQTITSLSCDVPEAIDVEKEKEKLSSKKMVELWNSHTQDKAIWYKSCASKLYRILTDFFGGRLEAFRKYCAAIGNTKFLMGNAPNSKFKAFFYWAIKPEVIKSIFQGAYGVQDILSQIGNISEQDKLQYEINTIGYEILNVEKKIEYSKQEIIDSQEKMIREHRQTVSDEVKGQILRDVEDEVNEKYPLEGYSQKNREMLVNVQYHTALVNHSRAELKLCKPEDIVIPPELFAKKKSLEESRATMCKRLEQVMKENLEAQKGIQTLVERAA